jgi:hypothetical protein
MFELADGVPSPPTILADPRRRSNANGKRRSGRNPRRPKGRRAPDELGLTPGTRKRSRRQEDLAERCSGLAAASAAVGAYRLSVVPSVKWGLERETGLEPATFSLEGLSGYAQ